MANKRIPTVLGGFLGLIVGVLLGGYLGLIVGGTFLGGFDIYDNIGIEGYELAAYVGAIIGGILLMRIGVKIALKNYDKNIHNG